MISALPPSNAIGSHRALLFSVPTTTPVPSDAGNDHNRHQHYANGDHDMLRYGLRRIFGMNK
jgi:hypothetical protein